MITLKVISTALVVALSLSAFSNEKKPNRKMRKAMKMTTLTISNPTMEWGKPEDVNLKSIEKLKTGSCLLFNAPLMFWGSPEEIDLKAIEKLKTAPLIASPEMVWGNPNDVHYFAISK